MSPNCQSPNCQRGHQIQRRLDRTGAQQFRLSCGLYPQSLWEIDRLFDEHSQNGAARPGGLLSSGLGQRVFAVGSYVGEVVRRKLGGDWIGDDSDPEAEINVELQLPDGTRCWQSSVS
jgi:hypothetical protein